jgi:hypothetical protein
LPVLPAEKVKRLSLGVPVLDNVFPGFELGDFAVLHGDSVSFMIFLLCVRGQLPGEDGGLDSPVVFVDGGNSFNPYIVAEIARSYRVDPKQVLGNIYVSRAFTAYQLSSLLLEKLEVFLKAKKAKLLLASDISALFFDRDILETDAKDLFMKVCVKLSAIAANKQAIVIVSYLPGKKSKRGLFFDTVLFAKSNVSIRFDTTGKILTFNLEDHPRVKPFSMDLPTDYTQLTAFMEV